jgi:hypothetical protein
MILIQKYPIAVAAEQFAEMVEGAMPVAVEPVLVLMVV